MHNVTPKHGQCGDREKEKQEEAACIGVITVVKDERQDNKKKCDNYKNYNQNGATVKFVANKATNNRRYNERRYDNQDNYGRYNNGKFGCKNKWENPHKNDKPFRKEGPQNRWDFHNKPDNVQNRRDCQGGPNGANRPLSVLQNYDNAIVAHKWRVVCDSMLGGLSSKLRMCGVDCVHVLFDQGGDDSAKLAMQENRILLTRNKNCDRVRRTLISL